MEMSKKNDGSIPVMAKQPIAAKGKPMAQVGKLPKKEPNTAMGKGSASEQYPTKKNRPASVTLGNNKGPIGSNPWSNSLPGDKANNFNG